MIKELKILNRESVELIHFGCDTEGLELVFDLPLLNNDKCFFKNKADF